MYHGDVSTAAVKGKKDLKNNAVYAVQHIHININNNNNSNNTEIN